MNKAGVLLVALVCAAAAWGQDGTVPEFIMSNATVEACDGLLFDSGYDAAYSINEDYTFTVLSDEPIAVYFIEEFCIEIGFDVLEIHDGPDTNAPLIGAFDGFELPPSFTSSGSVTFHFTSNVNVSYCGFQILWEVLAPPPVPPVLDPLPPVCETHVFPFAFEPAIGCAWLLEETVSLSTPNGTLDIVDINLACLGDSAAGGELVLEDPIDFNCSFTLELQLLIPDACDSLWYFPFLESITYDQCPIRSETAADPPQVCAGICSALSVDVEGCFEHTFLWDNGATSPTNNTVCPDSTTTYYVTITEVPTGQTTVDSVTVEVIDAVIQNAPLTMCQSDPLLDLVAVPDSGEWLGTGIINAAEGWFEPDSALMGANEIIFVANAFCADTVSINMIPIATDSANAACPNGDPFLLNATPPGGVWSGTGVLPDGTFAPDSIGSFLLTYEVNGCEATQIMNVGNLSDALPQPVWCQSEWADSLYVAPFGGTWSGPGIIDADEGLFDPDEAGPGVHTLFYALESCDRPYTVEVLGIDAGGVNRNACPEQPPHVPYPNFSPPDGSWNGLGITDPVSGMFDPSIIPNDTWTDLIYTAPNGCQDTVRMYVRQTVILEDPYYQCDNWDNLPLNWDFVKNSPWGGTWTGTGTVNPQNNDWEFNNGIAGVGEFVLTYTNNTCVDSMLMVVHPVELPIDEVDVCGSAPAFEPVPGLPAGAWFSGEGVDENQPTWFDPAAAGPGDHVLIWETPAGCNDQITVAVEEDFPASISGLDSLYCWQDTDIPVNIEPANGTFSGPVTNGLFNPSSAGAGQHWVTVAYTGVLCASSDSVEVEVLPEIAAVLTVSDTLICPDQGVQLAVSPEGGNPGSNLEVSWNEGLLPLLEHAVSPNGTTTYSVEVNDGCSDPFVDSVQVVMLPPIQASVTTSDTLCIGQEGWVTAEVLNDGAYDIRWGEEALPLDTLYAGAGMSSVLQITDLTEGCTFDTLTLVPNFTPISALFSPNPNDDCIAFEANPITFLDLSQFGLYGMWHFGTGDSLAYSPGNNPEYPFEQPGEYSVALTIFNEGDCRADYGLDVCVLPPSALFVPDVFSPNGDGANDLLFVRGRGITELYFAVYNQWGAVVFESNDPDRGWDGQFRGRPSPSGVYSYVLRAVVNDWSKVEQTGNIALIR